MSGRRHLLPASWWFLGLLSVQQRKRSELIRLQRIKKNYMVAFGDVMLGNSVVRSVLLLLVLHLCRCHCLKTGGKGRGLLTSGGFWSCDCSGLIVFVLLSTGCVLCWQAALLPGRNTVWPRSLQVCFTIAAAGPLDAEGSSHQESSTSRWGTLTTRQLCADDTPLIIWSLCFRSCFRNLSWWKK